MVKYKLKDIANILLTYLFESKFPLEIKYLAFLQTLYYTVVGWFNLETKVCFCYWKIYMIFLACLPCI